MITIEGHGHMEQIFEELAKKPVFDVTLQLTKNRLYVIFKNDTVDVYTGSKYLLQLLHRRIRKQYLGVYI